MARNESAPGPPRLGPSFQLIMQVRALLTAITLFSLRQDQIDMVSTLMVVGLAFLYWLAARYWARIVPRVMAHPLLTGVDLFVCLAVLSFEGPSGPFFQSTIAASAVAGLLFRWRGMLLVSVTQIVCYFAALGYYSALLGDATGSIANFQTLFSQPAYYPLVGLVGIMLRKVFDEQAAAEAARRDAEIRTIAASERARLAREMHDSLAKTLRGIAMAAQALPIWVRKSPERAATEAQRIASSAEVASREARELIADLRDDQVQHPLVRTVRDVTKRWSEQHRVPITVDLNEDAELPLVARYELVAILKEALTNIDRHANASSVSVSLRIEESTVTLVIEDDGDGFATPQEEPNWLDELARAGHYGVVGMNERAKRAGAELSVRSAPGAGTKLVVTFASESVQEAVPETGTGERLPAEAG